MCNFEPGNIAVGKNGKTLVYVFSTEKGRCFSGAELFTGDMSAFWLKKNFEKENMFKRMLLKKYKEAVKALREDWFRELVRLGVEYGYSEGGFAENKKGWLKYYDEGYTPLVIINSITSSTDSSIGGSDA